MRIAIFVLLLSLAVAQASARTGPGAGDRPSPCEQTSYEDHPYRLCRVSLAQFSVRLFWRRPDGVPYNYLSALPKMDEKGGRFAFALNGGMFDPDYRPVGLYIENGHEFARANTNAGPGNFHLKPNGVFFVGERQAGVMDTEAFLKRKPKTEFATQSGPMLVIEGKLHPRLASASASAKRRDGVCVLGGTTILFAISEGEVSFATFERFFQTGLKCRNALFLDGGSAPALYEPAASREGNMFLGLGPMIAVYEHPRPAAKTQP